MADFFSGFASGFASGREGKQNRQNAALKAAHEAYQQQMEERKLQMEREKFDYSKEKDSKDQQLSSDKFEYEKKKDTQDFQLKAATYETDADFKKAQKAKMEAEIGKMARESTAEQLKTQISYFSTWSSLSPEQQNDKSKAILINAAYKTGLITEEQANKYNKMSVPEFHMNARAGLGMSANALNAQKYQTPTQDNSKSNSSEAEMRKEFTGLNKDYQTQYGAYQRIQASAKDPSAAGDLAMIFNYMKLLDPGSTVREGEFATAQNAAGLPERIRAMYNKTINGERLTEGTRKDFIDRSEMLYGAAKKGYTNLKKTYEGIAKRSGLNPENITVNYESDEESQAKPQVQDPSNSTAPPQQPVEGQAPIQGGVSYKLPSGSVVDQATLEAKAKQHGLSVEDIVARIKASGGQEVEAGGASSPEGESQVPPMTEESVMIKHPLPKAITSSGIRL